MIIVALHALGVQINNCWLLSLDWYGGHTIVILVFVSSRFFIFKRREILRKMFGWHEQQRRLSIAFICRLFARVDSTTITANMLVIMVERCHQGCLVVVQVRPSPVVVGLFRWIWFFRPTSLQNDVLRRHTHLRVLCGRINGEARCTTMRLSKVVNRRPDFDVQLAWLHGLVRRFDLTERPTVIIHDHLLLTVHILNDTLIDATVVWSVAWLAWGGAWFAWMRFKLRIEKVQRCPSPHVILMQGLQ